MTEYLSSVLDDLPGEFAGEASTPAASYLFDVNNNCEKLNSKATTDFHHLVLQLLFLWKRGHPYIQTAIAFLTTLIKEPDADEKKNILVVNYLCATKDLILILESDGNMNIYWWVDAVFTVHCDMKSHNGAFYPLEEGPSMAPQRNTSWTQKVWPRLNW